MVSAQHGQATAVHLQTRLGASPAPASGVGTRVGRDAVCALLLWDQGRGPGLCAATSLCKSRYQNTRLTDLRTNVGRLSALHLPAESGPQACRGDSVRWHSGHTERSWRLLSRPIHSPAGCASVPVPLRIVTLWVQGMQQQAESDHVGTQTQRRAKPGQGMGSAKRGLPENMTPKEVRPPWEMWGTASLQKEQPVQIP